MDIKLCMQQMHNAASEQERNKVKEEIKLQFSSLPDSEKEEVRVCFMQGLDEKLQEADRLISKMDIAPLAPICNRRDKNDKGKRADYKSARANAVFG
jgi:hypothetical protein